MIKATWRKLIEDEAGVHGDRILSWTLTDEEADAEFDYGTSEDTPFTAWGTYRVYFPAVHYGVVRVESVPRDPCDEPTSHVGGQ